ncbi:MAG: SDR family oxidoreductase [Acidobacteria bacterium]|nr:MAG: SDR family oxidoreductase [Acidobacteriota bacterium]
MSPPFYSLITGASSGIGECFARQLAARGKNVLLVARSGHKLETLGSELKTKHTILAEPLEIDLSVPGAGGQLARQVNQRGYAIDLLVNNAGFGARGKFWELPFDQQTSLMRLQIEALMELTYHLLPGMIERQNGGIINVSSMTGFQPIPYATAYAATKAFMSSFSMAIREELRPYKVAVVTLCPGGTRTNFVNIGAREGRHKFPGGPQPPEEVVNDALMQLQQGGGLVVPRLVNKASIFAQRFLPRETVARLLARMSKP